MNKCLILLNIISYPNIFSSSVMNRYPSYLILFSYPNIFSSSVMNKYPILLDIFSPSRSSLMINFNYNLMSFPTQHFQFLGDHKLCYNFSILIICNLINSSLKSTLLLDNLNSILIHPILIHLTTWQFTFIYRHMSKVGIKTNTK